MQFSFILCVNFYYFMNMNINNYGLSGVDFYQSHIMRRNRTKESGIFIPI